MRKFVLTISVLANLVVGTWVCVCLNADAGGPPGRSEKRSPSNSIVEARPTDSEAGRVAPDDLLDEKTMAEYRRLAQREGIPDHVVRAVIKSTVHTWYSQLRLELRGTEPAAPYWSNDFGAVALMGGDPATRERLATLEQEEREAIRRLLGVAVTDYSIDEIASVRRFIGQVSPEAASLFCVTFLEKMHRLQPELVGADSASRKAMADRLRSEVREQVAALLSPQELAEFDLRNDEELRRKLRAFRPTEPEFKVLSELYRQSRVAVGNSAEVAASDAGVQLEGQIASVLGGERFEEYKHATDPRLTMHNLFVARLGLPLSAAVRLAAIESEFRHDLAELNNGRRSASARHDAYGELVLKAESAVTDLLGDSGAGLYKRGLGRWLTVSPYTSAQRR